MTLTHFSNLFELMSNFPYFLILLTIFTTYSYVIFKGGFCSDDLQGIEQYDGTLLYPVELKNGDVEKDAQGQVIKRPKICYGTLSKWVRYHLCGGNFPSSHHYPTRPDGTKGDEIPSGKVPSHHHALSIIVASIAAILLYNFLITITTPKVALLAVLLFIVHPTCVQAIAWPSAIGYILSLICICASLNISHWVYIHQDLNHLLIGLAGLSLFQIWGVYAQGIPLFTWTILLALGQWQMAIVAFIFSGLAGFTNLRGYVVHRKEEFKKQKMEGSTSINIRKPIVALKTLAYYVYLAIWPAKMGLYHEWGFHYNKKMELWDWRAICGLLFFVASCYFFWTGTIEVRIGILWFYAFIMLFLNWITAQQWVTERYLYIPVAGLCLIAGLFLQHLLPLYFFIFGMFLCRTLCHLPTYDNELRFYLSNTWNFPKSEVAYGNLGVTYASAGLSGAANDMWLIGGNLNPDYDVPFYNLYSKTKSNAMMMIQNGNYEQGIQGLAQCIPMMEKVLACKVIHFPESWRKEYEELKVMVANPIALLVGEMNRLSAIKLNLDNLLNQAKDDKRRGEVLQSITDNNAQISRLNNFLLSKNIKIDYDPAKALLNKLTQH